jgi:S-adenosylmethionine:tRNA ribosyltransferase-isomerase
MHPRDIKIENYTYNLPEEKIAKHPANPRDSAKLLVYDGAVKAEDIYANIAQYLPANSQLVFNETKVVNARLFFRKPSGGVIEIFCLAPASGTFAPDTFAQTRRVQWECMVGGAAKWKAGQVLQLAVLPHGFTLSATMAAHLGATFLIEFVWDADLPFSQVLQFAGQLPLPPYLHRAVEAADEKSYQTLFASHEGSVAAPTAALHFTDAIVARLAEKNIQTSRITLHVGAGTFKQVKSASLSGHDMHAEWFSVRRETLLALQQSLSNNEKIVAVGTTSLRTLESLFWAGQKIMQKRSLATIAVSQWEPYDVEVTCSADAALGAIIQNLDENNLLSFETQTQILIAPSYNFKIANGLVTNFHQPDSTLLLLVAAFVGNNWKDIYDHALNNDYRFLSYGDGMLLLR